VQRLPKCVGRRRAAEAGAETYRVLGASVVTERRTDLAKLAFQVISERYDYRRSTCITTNRAFKDWTKVFPDALNAQVIAERLTERAEHFVLEKGFRTARP